MEIACHYVVITSGDCVSHGYSYITNKSECRKAGVQLDIQDTKTETYNGPSPGGNRNKYCGTFGGKQYLHFNSQTSGSLDGDFILLTATENTNMLYKTALALPTP